MCSVQAAIEADTPFGRIARPFFNGNDDEFRNNRFKLIPKVVDGNLMVKMAVKDTPTLLGNKLKQTYVKVRCVESSCIELYYTVRDYIKITLATCFFFAGRQLL
jgi:hypothetical protein